MLVHFRNNKNKKKLHASYYSVLKGSEHENINKCSNKSIDVNNDSWKPFKNHNLPAELSLSL